MTCLTLNRWRWVGWRMGGSGNKEGVCDGKVRLPPFILVESWLLKTLGMDLLTMDGCINSMDGWIDTIDIR